MALVAPPFPKSAALDNKNLVASGHTAGGNTRPTPPISPDACIPGEPCLPLDDVTVATYLHHELSTKRLDDLYPHLWAVAKRQGDHVDPLHRQVLKRRSILVSEDPGLHMVWAEGRVFFKPIPDCLVNYQFWIAYLSGAITNKPSISLQSSHVPSSQDLRLVALGFVRSYAYLIRHRSDFKVAVDNGLLPGSCTWEQWSIFLSYFRSIDDLEVAQRYRYGQIRLSRLNWASRIFRPMAKASLFYEMPHWSTRRYLEAASIPLLFIFAGISLALSAMQVMLAVSASDMGFTNLAGLQSYSRIFWGFSIAVVVFFTLCLVSLLALLFTVIGGQTVWGYLHREK
ncbi:Hypothetical protein R9X50_00195900 [Acrodontium crateriforme]|uniref:Subtilisin-like serine protease n=1 Tax=Acrodontium crateriforme TaxID=150365 RepID=A0AAQ3M022_9PEZI|nr:Hypothetical protein R9X50_00195900 [Acrodontium crateriforme]